MLSIIYAAGLFGIDGFAVTVEVDARENLPAFELVGLPDMAVKEANPDCVLFYRLGDFYEMFFDDAVRVSRELELTLTGRDCGLPERAPMCGVPHHSVDMYLKRLVERGYKIAICEQLTDPAETKGIVERGGVRIVTPGTLIESSMLEDGVNN